jgi:hypothetical protein
MDIKTIPTDELLSDLAETRENIKACEIAMGAGVFNLMSGGSILDRHWTNVNIERAIVEELSRRGIGEAA